MKRAAATLAVAALLASPLATGPVAASDAEDGPLREGLSLMEEGARLLFRGLLDELEPALRDLEGLIDDLSAYHPPEILPNGDIIIRRKVPLTPPPDEGEIDL